MSDIKKMDYYYGYDLVIMYKDGTKVTHEISRHNGFYKNDHLDIDDFESDSDYMEKLYICAYAKETEKYPDKIIYHGDKWQIKNKESIEKYSYLVMNYAGEMDTILRIFYMSKH